MKELSILGIRIDPFSLDESIRVICEALESGKEQRIVTANPELIISAEKDQNLREVINTADLVLPDGIGVVWAARQLGYHLQERVTGIDLAIRLLEESNRRKWRVFLLGAKPGIAEKAVTEQYKKYPGIVFACHHGYYSSDEEPMVLERIKKFDPNILMIGLGAPRQELFSAANEGLAKIRIGVGGTIDVLSGDVKRAPKIFRNNNLEWLYRLVTDPSRIRRQAVLPLYVLKVLRRKGLARDD